MTGWTATRRTAWPDWSNIRGATAASPPLSQSVLWATLQLAPTVFGIARPRWRLADLRERFLDLESYSLAGVSKLVKRLRIRRQRGRLSVHSPDPAYFPKLDWVEQAREATRRQPDRVRLLYGDEFSLYRQPTLAPTYAPQGTEPTALLSHRSNTRQRISGALDIESGRVVWTARSKMGVVGLCHFLRTLRQAYPAETLLLVWDNWPVHQHPTVLAEAARLEIELLWLPTYAPWTNFIEKLWRWLKADRLHHHQLADDWAALKATVAEFLDQFAAGSQELLRYVGALPE
jgi:transposase